MPNCFQLFPKGTDKPAVLQGIDEAICKRFDWPCHEKWWVEGWYNVVGWGIAVKGHPLGSPELRAYVSKITDHDATRKVKMLRILDFLEDSYSSNAWVQIGKAS